MLKCVFHYFLCVFQYFPEEVFVKDVIFNCIIILLKGPKKSGLLATAMSAFTVPVRSAKMGIKRRKTSELHALKKHSVANTGEMPAQIKENDETAPSQPSSLSSSKLDVFNGHLSILRQKSRLLVRRKKFEGFITFCIVANTIVMATEHHNMSLTLEAVISISNYVSTVG